MSILTNALILATEGGIPTSNPWSQLALPLGVFIFVGSVYLLLRSNLGTRRGYLVMSVSLWGFGFLLSLFWAFGAPGTPANTGPQNLPGQQLDEYQPTWRPFAADSAFATEDGSPYAAASSFPDGWGPVPADFEGEASTGASNISSFFASLDGEGYTNILVGTEGQVGDTRYAEADDGRPMIAVTLARTCQFPPTGAPELPAYCEGLEVGDIVPEGAVDDNGNDARGEQTLFAFFDAGAPYFPSLVMSGAMLVLFVLHMLLLARDEARERRELEAAAAEETVEVEERTTVSV